MNKIVDKSEKKYKIKYYFNKKEKIELNTILKKVFETTLNMKIN